MTVAAPDLLGELLRDAKLLAAYGQRTGLIKDKGLFTAIAEVERADELDWKSPKIVELQSRIAETMSVVEPKVLIGLRDGWEPYGSGSRRNLRKLALVLFSFLLMGFAAIYTLSYNHGTMILGQLEALEKDRPAEKIGHIARQLIGAETVLTKIDSGSEGSVSREAYFELIDEWRSFDNRINLAMSLSLQFVLENDFWLSVAAYRERIGALFAPGLPVNAVTVASAVPVVPETQGTAAVVPSLLPSLATNSVKQYACAQGAITDAGDDPILASLSRSRGIACIHKVTYSAEDMPSFDYMMVKIRNIMAIYGLWLLPALYGAAGATVYHLRAVLNPLTPDPPLAWVVHRIALGAFSGVILAWFFSPTSDFEKDLTAVGLNFFGAAFLVGFSIEVFFTLLDRFVAVTVGAIGRIGAAPGESNVRSA